VESLKPCFLEVLKGSAVLRLGHAGQLPGAPNKKTRKITACVTYTVGQQRLNWLSPMCIENDILKTIGFKPILSPFSAKKFCKRLC